MSQTSNAIVRNAKEWVPAVLGFVLLSAGVSLWDGPSPSPKPAKDDAWLTARQLILGHLEFPSTADFGSQSAEEAVTENPNGTFTIKGWVDSQSVWGPRCVQASR